MGIQGGQVERVVRHYVLALEEGPVGRGGGGGGEEEGEEGRARGECCWLQWP